MQGLRSDAILPRDASGGSQTRGTEGGDTVQRDESHRSKVDVVLETGLTPKTFIIEKIDAHGGRLKQQDICDITGWSAGAISNLLVEMEDAGSIERVWIGREKMVYLPGAKSDLAAPPDTGEAGSR